MKQRSALFAAVVLAACTNSTSGVVVTRVDPVTSDAKCPAGGVTISVGKDTNGDGALSDAEVTQTTEVCNGAAGSTGPAGSNGSTGAPGASGDGGTAGAAGDAGAPGAAAYVNTTLLGASDAHCLNGGVQVDFGLDDGAGGGIAGDGLLEPGEIRSTTFVCNGLTPTFPGSTAPPTGPAGAFTIQAKGGNGTINGGNGGSLAVHLSKGTLGGNVKLFSTGAVDAGFTVPQLAFTAGSTPMLVTADTTLLSFASSDDAVDAGARFYQLSNDGRVFADDAGVVTSISVAAAVTLTIAGDVTSASITVANDVLNAGTITCGRLNVTGAKGLSLASARFLSTAGSSIDLTGLPDAPDQSAGPGGALSISAGGGVQSLGVILTSGGAGQAGASSGSVSLNSNGADCFVAGVIDTHGGSGTNGGDVNVTCRSVANAAAITASGGSSPGSSFTGGNGGQISLSSQQGAVHNTGALTSLGGACLTELCGRGNGGSVSLRSTAGALVSNATLDASGGGNLGNGGIGGSIELTSSGQDSSDSAPAGSIHLSGDLRVNGPDTTIKGGSGGSITITLNPAAVVHGEEIELLGYSGIDLSGGFGMTSFAGHGGAMEIFSSASSLFGNLAQPSGAVLNTAKINLRGGDGASAGQGGTLDVSTQRDVDFSSPAEFVSNSAPIDVSGGNSANDQAANAGQITFFSESKVYNAGALTANGGTGSGYNGGGPGGRIDLSSNGLTENSAPLRANGGSGTQYGGGGGLITAGGEQLTNSGALSATGGNAATQGGSGGSIALSSRSGATSNTGTLVVTPGNGTVAGSPGSSTIDGLVAP